MRGTISTDISVALGYVPVRLPAMTSCTAFGLWTLDGAPWYYATKVDGADGVLVTNGTTGFQLFINEAYGKLTAGSIVCYAKGTTTTKLTGIVTA